MKIVVLNDSSETNNDSTSLILAPFQDGMREAGAELTLFRTEELEIKPCRGCKKCLYKTPGECYQRDDMQRVLSELSRAQIWVYATQPTPSGLSASMKRLVNRMLPLTWQTTGSRRNPTRSLKKLLPRFLRSTKPAIEIQDNGPHDISQPRTKAGKLALVSGCDNRELRFFEPLVEQIQSVARTHNKEFAGALLRPHPGVTASMLEAGSLLDDVVTAAYEAGRHLVLDGTMPPEALAVVSRGVLPRETSVTPAKRDVQQASAAA